MAAAATSAAESVPPACRNLLCVSMNHIQTPTPISCIHIQNRSSHPFPLDCTVCPHQPHPLLLKGKIVEKGLKVNILHVGSRHTGET